jgi:hypothetical protein
MSRSVSRGDARRCGETAIAISVDSAPCSVWLVTEGSMRRSQPVGNREAR